MVEKEIQSSWMEFSSEDLSSVVKANKVTVLRASWISDIFLPAVETK